MLLSLMHSEELSNDYGKEIAKNSITGISPIAWKHVILTGKYKF